MTQMGKTVAGIVEKNEMIARGVYELNIKTGICNEFVPGQFINIYLDDRSMLLPRPISISEAGNGNVTVIYKAVGKGTEYLSGYAKGGSVVISSPLGNGFGIKDDYTGRHIALVAGGIGAPPLVGLAKALRGRNAAITAYLGFQSDIFLADRFRGLSENVFISTDDGSCGFHGNVVEMLMDGGHTYDEYFACGPKVMLRALCAYIEEIGRNVQVSLEERMGCGYGACLGCVCRLKDGDKIARKRVCADGPVFMGKEVAWD